jgi:hypothetical protein
MSCYAQFSTSQVDNKTRWHCKDPALFEKNHIPISLNLMKDRFYPGTFRPYLSERQPVKSSRRLLALR